MPFLQFLQKNHNLHEELSAHEPLFLFFYLALLIIYLIINLRCFCQKYDISQFKETESYLEGIFGEIAEPSKIVEEAIRTKCRSISYTYNEPTIFIEFVKDIAELAKKKGLKNVLVTNGYKTHEC